MGFNNATWLYGTRVTVGKYNTIWFCDFLQPIIAIKLINIGVGVQKVTPNQCDIIKNLSLCIGAKIMLIQNIQVELGLVNGITGIIENIVWKAHTDIKKDQPQSLLIAINSYNGLALFSWQDRKKVVPIFSVFHE